VIVTGNVQPVQAGRGMAMVNEHSCTALTVSGNTLAPDGIQQRSV
jgi:hypothetical protein